MASAFVPGSGQACGSAPVSALVWVWAPALVVGSAPVWPSAAVLVPASAPALERAWRCESAPGLASA